MHKKLPQAISIFLQAESPEAQHCTYTVTAQEGDIEGTVVKVKEYMAY